MPIDHGTDLDALTLPFSAGRQPSPPPATRPSSDDSLDAVVIEDELRRTLEAAVARLPGPEREAVACKLKLGGDLTTGEVAAQLGKPADEVERLLRRGA